MLPKVVVSHSTVLGIIQFCPVLGYDIVLSKVRYRILYKETEIFPGDSIRLYPRLKRIEWSKLSFLRLSSKPNGPGIPSMEHSDGAIGLVVIFSGEIQLKIS